MTRNFPTPPVKVETAQEKADRRAKFIIGNPSDPELAKKRAKDLRKIRWKDANEKRGR